MRYKKINKKIREHIVKATTQANIKAQRAIILAVILNVKGVFGEGQLC